MDIVTLISSFTNQDAIFRFALIIVIAIYGLFALIVAIQLGSLNKTLNLYGFSSVFNFIAVAHFMAAIALLALSVLSL